MRNLGYRHNRKVKNLRLKMMCRAGEENRLCWLVDRKLNISASGHEPTNHLDVDEKKL